MEGEKRKVEFEKQENDIVFSKAIKAGKRIYYLDVKKSRNEELFLAITESKKKIQGSDANVQVTYEKHKIFLYKEDFDKFTSGLNEVVAFIKREQGEEFALDSHVKETSDHTATEEAVNIEQSSANQEVSEERKKRFFNKFKF